jgi:hypothetical protein
MTAAIIDGAAPEVQAEFDSLWRALDGNIQELTQRLDALEARLPRPIPVVTPLARPLAPVPDYRSELPAEVEVCSCDEAVELRRQLDEAQARNADLEERLRRADAQRRTLR